MKYLLVLLLGVVHVEVISAQQISAPRPDEMYLFEKHSSPPRVLSRADSNNRGYNVQRYDLFMDWRPPLDSLSWNFKGENIVTLVLDSALSTIVFDGAGIHIDGATVNGVAVVPQQPANEQFSVPLDRAHAVGDTLVIDLKYTRTSTSELGLYMYDKNTFAEVTPHKDSMFTAERIVYTMSEPRDAHWWMPCKDDPSDKALSTISVLVPPGNLVSSNGILQGVEISGEGLKFVWKEDEPIATYLMCASASKFSTWRANYARNTNANDTVPIYYYVWQVDSTNADSSGAYYNAAYMFRNIPQIMAGFSRHFGEFPFTKYGMTAVQKFNVGGMEHQTMTTINRVWLRANYEVAMAHEMTHQWFGDDITCATWKDIWLNEGFASFGEDIYEEFMFGKSAYDQRVLYQMVGYLNAADSVGRNVAIYDPEGQGRNAFNGPTTYAKGALVLHMLRRVVGDSLFFGGLRSYLAKFHFQSATTQDFVDAMSQYTGQDLQWFFDEWVFGKGHPRYEIYPSNYGRAYLQLSIVQETWRPFFRMPVKLRLFYDLGSVDTVVMDTDRSQFYDLTSVYHNDALGWVDSISFDPDNSILKDSTFAFQIEKVASGELPVNSVSLSVQAFPNPLDRISQFRISSNKAVRGQLDVCDLLGRVVSTYKMQDVSSNSIFWDAENVPSGTYVARLTTTSGVARAMIRVVH